jgi:BlaI family transcriptional regulator, penicillinase repressor
MKSESSRPPALSRRERQILDVLYRIGPASVAQVRESMDDPPGYSSVRTLLGVMVEKGHLTHAREGTRYIYRPCTPPDVAGRSALSSLVRTFFGGSVQGAVSALLQAEDVDEDTLDELARLVDAARKEDA